MGGEIVYGELENFGHAVEFDLTAGEGRRVERGFVIVAEKVLIAGAVAGRGERGGQQALGQDYARAEPGAI